MRQLGSFIVICLMTVTIGCTCISSPSVCRSIKTVEKYGGRVSDDWPYPRFVYLNGAESHGLSDKEMGEIIQALRSFKTLEGFYFTGSGITDLSMEKIATLRSLKYVSIVGTKITPDGVELLGNLPLLQRVGLSGAQFTPTAIERLRKEMPRVAL